jgi:hypothetical protein
MCSDWNGQRIKWVTETLKIFKNQLLRMISQGHAWVAYAYNPSYSGGSQFEASLGK